MHTSKSMRLLRRWSWSAGEDCCGCVARYSTCSAVAAAPAIIIIASSSTQMAIISSANGYFCGFTVTPGAFLLFLFFFFWAAGCHSSPVEWVLGGGGSRGRATQRGWPRACRVYKFYTLIDFWTFLQSCHRTHTFLSFTLQRVEIITVSDFLLFRIFHWFGSWKFLSF